MILNTHSFKRSDRVSQQIKDIISTLFTSKVSIKGSGLITITRVKTSDNLRFSRIYLSFLDNKIEANQLIDLMNSNIKEYRFDLGKSLKMQYVPKIKFYYDNTFEEIEHIAELINKTKK